jgi:hypothetical protein
MPIVTHHLFSLARYMRTHGRKPFQSLAMCIVACRQDAQAAQDHRGKEGAGAYSITYFLHPHDQARNEPSIPAYSSGNSTAINRGRPFVFKALWGISLSGFLQRLHDPCGACLGHDMGPTTAGSGENPFVPIRRKHTFEKFRHLPTRSLFLIRESKVHRC